eukprot:TRINITY_DN14281_c0_g1_i1.p1 TRINITY_DN14281_c0_g1~~TRINITY_DN14281_c0_g1_i1.p1  ORF type:complete len:347 (+),score=59.24 TRINITY_DN14281_c0_g1_i1:132-1043(+)
MAAALNGALLGQSEVRRVMQAVSAAVGPDHDVLDAKLEFDTSDAILCDAMRCLLAHDWVTPVIRRGDAHMFFPMKCSAGPHLFSLYSSEESFAAFADVIGDHDVAAIPRSLSEVLATDLPRMSLEACKAQGKPAETAVRGIMMDPHPSENPGLFLTDSCFPLLYSFQKRWVLYMKVLAIVNKANEEGPAAITAAEWRALFTAEEPLVALLFGDSGMVAMESGLPLSCYPGDAVKVRNLQKPAANVIPIDVETAFLTLKAQADQNKNVQIIAAVIPEGSGLQCHALTITPQVFKDHVASALMRK